MKASQLMTKSVLSVAPETPVRRIAELLLQHGISALPVLREETLVGIVSESDLVVREAAAKQRRSWLSALLARPSLGAGTLDAAIAQDNVAADIMSSPVITVSADASLDDVVKLMAIHGIKRLPVMHDGHLAGIISRADLIRAWAVRGADAPASRALPDNVFTHLDKSFHAAMGHTTDPALDAAEATEQPAAPEITAKELLASAQDFKKAQAALAARTAEIGREHHMHDVAGMLDAHLTEDFWRRMLLDARRAAENGLYEILVLRFHREICSDAGRAINVCETGWHATLRGLPGQIWHRSQDELRPHGFRLVARTLEYPGGMPGDIGLFLMWGQG